MICEIFNYTHLDYGDIFTNQPNNAAAAITGAKKRTSRVNIYQQLGLKSQVPEDECDIFVIIINYWLIDNIIFLFYYTSATSNIYKSSPSSPPLLKLREWLYKNFFPNVIRKLNKTDINVGSSTSFLRVLIE